MVEAYYLTQCHKYLWRGSGGPQWGLMTAPPMWGLGAKPLVKGSEGRSPPETDDDLLIQQQNFCAHSYVYEEIQLQLSRSGLF